MVEFFIRLTISCLRLRRVVLRKSSTGLQLLPRHWLLAVGLHRQFVAPCSQFFQLVDVCACSGRDQTTHDYVFFQTMQLVRFPWQAAWWDTRCFLKDAAEIKDRVCKDALVIPCRIGRPSGGRFFSFIKVFLKFDCKLITFNMLTNQIGCIANAGDFNFCSI